MKKKILAIILSVVMLAALLVPMFAISAEDNPTITLYLDDPYVEGDVLWVPVYMSGNSEEMCAIEYKLYSLEKLTPRKLKSGTVTDSYIDQWGDEIPITFEPKGTAFPEYDGYSGFKVLNDAVTDVYNRGIKVDGGLIAIASFILPEDPGEYNFRVLGVSAAAFVEGANNKQDVKSYDIINGSDVMFRIECAEGEHVEKDVNVVAPDCDTPGSKDVVCSVCGKTLRTGETIPETNEHVDADNKWETNETQHFHTCSCGEIIDAEDHKGGEATCKDKAVCSVCGVAYGEKNATNHAGGTEVRGYDAPSCNEPGYTGDTYCLGCNEKLEDGEPIDATGEHVDADNDWETNGTQHFHTCACGTEFDKEDHKGGEATCKDKAVCSVCNVAYGEKNATNHAGGTEVRGYDAPSCNEPGYTGDTYCLGCNEKLEDGEPIDATGEHVDADNDWETNGTQHFHTCACGTEFDKEDHKGGEATCKDKAVCSVCNVAYGEKNATNHTGGTEVRDASEAKCNTPGYTGDTYCLGCNEKLEDGEPINPTGAHVDADNKWETNGTQHFHTCACGTEFDKEDHFGGEANCKDKAVCSVCNVAYGEIDADNHDFSGKVTIKEEPTSEKGGKYTVECVNGCGNSDERDSKKLANSIEDKEAGVTIKSDEAILPEDITLTIDESTAKEEDGKYSVTFNFTSQLVNTLSGKAEFVLSLEDTDDMDNIQISAVNADGTTTVISEIKDGKLVFSADLDGTYVLSFTDKVEDEKKEETPKTSDSMNIAVVVLVALVAAAGLAVVGKKRIAL